MTLFSINKQFWLGKTTKIVNFVTRFNTSAANDIFNYWLPIIGEFLPCSLLEQVKKKDSDYETVQDILTEYELIVDSYEQARERPGDNEEQKKYYSGKKANHTILDFRF